MHDLDKVCSVANIALKRSDDWLGALDECDAVPVSIVNAAQSTLDVLGDVVTDLADIADQARQRNDLLEDAPRNMIGIAPIVAVPRKMDRDGRMAEMKNWCAENISNPWTFVAVTMITADWSAIAIFSCTEDAVMFKLRWGIA